MDIQSFILGVQKGKASSNVNGLDEIEDILDEINGEVIGENLYHVTFMYGETQLCTVDVYDGYDCPNPVTNGTISTPTKESTETINYTFDGWSLTDDNTVDNSALKSVTEDRTVYVVFKESTRYYTIRFFDGETLLKTEKLTYLGSSNYTYKKDNYIFNGWNPEPKLITGDMDCQAVLVESYAFADASWAYIADVSERGLASEAFSIGDTKTITLTNSSGTQFSTDVQIVGFNHDDLADGSGKAGISIISVPSFHCETCFNSPKVTSDNKSYAITHNNRYDGETFRASLLDLIYNALQQDIKNIIKTVSKEFSYYEDALTNGVATVNDTVWIPSCYELGLSVGYGGTIAKDEGSPYEYFTSETMRKKNLEKLDGTSTVSEYGTRTLIRSVAGASGVCVVSAYGTGDNLSFACDSMPFGFCV